MKSSISKKIVQSMVEDKFLQKTIKKIEKTIDKKLGRLSRNYIFKDDPIQNNKILMLTQQGDYTCNEKFITQELLDEDVDCEIVWGLRKEQMIKSYELPHDPRVKMVQRFTYDFYKELSSCKILIINAIDPYKAPLRKKVGQYVIQTWHGSLGIKKFDKNSFNGSEWVKAALLCGKETDFCISNSEFEDNIYRTTYWENTPILRFGHPRNDIFFWNDEKKGQLIDNIKRKYHLSSGKRYILYAPTFRDNHRFDCYNIDYERLIKACKNKFGGDWGVLVRFHLNVRRFAQNVLKGNSNIVDVTDYPDIQELMLLADIGITDYSSWIYDFILTKKPGFIFATDLTEYNNERGLCYKLEETPFPIAATNDKLMKNIELFDLDSYQEKVNEFLLGKGCVDDGKASFRTVQKLKEIMGEH